MKDYPEGFRNWVEDNADKIAEARKKGTAPYFIANNGGIIDRLMEKEKSISLNTQQVRANNNNIEVDAQTINEKEEVAILQSKAKEAAPYIEEISHTIAKKYDAFCTPINFKSKESILRKLHTEQKEQPNYSLQDIKDSVRTTIIAPKSKIGKIADMLHKTAGDNGRLKIQKTPLGYTGILANVECPNGLIGEIQANTPKMIYAKEPPKIAKAILGDNLWNKIFKEVGLPGGLGHKYYEQYRILDPFSDEAKRIQKLSLEYYSHFTN